MNFRKILTVLEANDGLCMDNEEERIQLAKALMTAIPAELVHDDDTEAEPCDECEAWIPHSAPSMISTHHEETCSLHPRNAT